MADKNNTDSGNKDAPGQKDLKDLKASKRSFWQTINPGYVVAGLSTLMTAVLAIHKNFHKTLEKKGKTGTIDQARQEAEDKWNAYVAPTLAEARAAFDMTLEEAKNSGATKAQGEKMIGKKWLKLVEGVEESGQVNNVLDKFLKLPSFYQAQAAATFITVTAIALGAVYSFNRERKLADKLHQQIADKAEQSQPQGIRI